MQNIRRLDPEPLHALTQALRAWVLTAVAWLATVLELPRDVRILVRKHLRTALNDGRILILALALTRWTCAMPVRRTRRPRSKRRGFRHARHHGGGMRCFKRLIRVRSGTIGGRIAQLRDVLFNLKTWIARMVARLDRVSTASRLVAVRPPACVFAGRSAPTCFADDTS